MRHFILGLMLVCFVGNAYATVTLSALDDKKDFQTVIASALAVASTATVETSIFPVLGGHYHGFWIKCAGSAPSVKIYLQQSYDRTAGNFANVQTSALVATITSSAIWIDNVAMAHIAWGRLQIIGQAGNGADTTIDIVYGRDTKQH